MKTFTRGLASYWLKALFFFATCLLTSSTNAAENSKTALVPQSSQSRQLLSHGSATLLYVGKIDGSITLLDSETGNIHWTFDTGSPLISSSRGKESNVQVFPGVDGSLYILNDDMSPNLELSRVTIAELVENSPSLTADGSIILGSQTATLYYLDFKTGKIVKTVSIDDRTNEIEEPNYDNEENTVIFVRKDYKVQSHDKTKSTVRWSISFAEIHHLDMSALPNPHALMEYIKKDQKLLETHSVKSPALTMGNDNSLYAKDPKTGWKKWSISFASAPVVAYTPENAGRNVLTWDALYAADSDMSPSTKIFPKPRETKTNSKVLVGSVSSTGGGLYALAAPVQSSLNPTAEPFKGVNVGDKKMLDLFEGKGDGEMDSLRCVLNVVNSSTQNGALPTLSKRDIKKTVFTAEESTNGMTTAAVLGLTIMVGYLAFASIQSRRQQRLEKLRPLERIRRKRSTGHEDDTGPIPEHCDGSVCIGEAKKGIDLNPSKTRSGSAEKKCPLSPVKGRSLPPLRVDSKIKTSLNQLSSQMQRNRHQRQQNGMYHENGMSEYSVSETKNCWANNTATREHCDNSPSYSPLIQRLPSQEEIFAWSAGTSDPNDRSLSALATSDDEYRILGRSLLNEVNEPSAFDHFDRRFGNPPKHCVGGCASSLQHPDEIFDLALSPGFNASPIHANWGTSNIPHSLRGYLANGIDLVSGKILYPQYTSTLEYQGLSNSSLSAMHGSSWASKSLNSHSNLNSEKFSFSNFKEGTVFKVGQLTLGPKVLGYGTAGTVVFDGEFQGRPVAVKRILKAFYDLAANEKDILIVSDEHPNLVRLFAVEEDKDFVFLALERCQMTLCEYVASDEGPSSLIEDNRPSTLSMRIMSDMCEGLQALHNRGVVHRDLKPHNVLMTENYRAKLSDMGLGRRLVPDQSSFFSSGSGGSSGWQAPEQLIIRQGGAARQTKAMDIFSLACMMYNCIAAGRHPFGESSHTRDDNILKNKPHLDALDTNPEGKDLISTMLEKDASKRPTIQEVLDHPFWWDSRRKLNFLIELSDRVENEDRQEDKTLIRAFEAMAGKATGGNWGARLDPLLVTNLGQYRKYTFTSLRDLLRVVRNKHNHYRELPGSLKQAIGSIPEGFCTYFVTRFPDLLMTTYSFAKEYLSSETPMDKYFVSFLEKKISNADSVSSPSSMPTIEEEFQQEQDPNLHISNSEAEEEVESPTGKSGGDSTPRLQVRTKPTNAVMRTISGDSVLSGSTGTPWDAVLNVIMENANKNNAENDQDKDYNTGRTYSPLRSQLDQQQLSPQVGIDGYAAGSKTPVLSPQYRPHPRGFDSLINTEREPRLESDLKKESADPYRDLQSPIRLSEGSKRYEDPSRPIVGWEEDSSNQKYTLLPFPRRPGSPICDFYQKTGFCKYHERCRFHHPPECAVRLNEDGLPVREGEPVCEFYKNTHQCKFGGACKFNHPNMKPIYAGSLNYSPQARPS